MSIKFSHIWQYVTRYKYVLTIVIGVIIVGFVDDNSFLKLFENKLHIAQMEKDIEKYNLQNEQATAALKELKEDPKAIEKIARERYAMKAEDEDVFVLSTDEVSGNNETENTSEVNETIK